MSAEEIHEELRDREGEYVDEGERASPQNLEPENSDLPSPEEVIRKAAEGNQGEVPAGFRAWAEARGLEVPKMAARRHATP